MIGRTLSHYRITTAIGAGGMGEVYRATDTKLGRDVALKVLPPDMARDPERLARFQREARAVAALNHPHIVTIFSVEEAEGVHFLTMELVEGLSLDRRIPASGLPVEQIIEIAGALADALSAAHEKGIMHRDLKPANVMVTEDGRVKVLDFGLAKDVRPESSSDATLTSAQTQVGVVMGTPAYMSPEQISGRALDHRTDIFSLGVMLHEMATGRRPFGGDSSAELMSAILRDHPPSVTDARADLPSDLARVIRRCLEKDPRHRLQTARDVSNEFRDLARQALSGQASQTSPAASSASRSPSAPDSGSARAEEAFRVAVLPFKCKGAEPGLEALAEGITEEIITGLSRFSYLRVISRASSSRYAEAADAGSAAKDLGARYVMEGSIRQAGAKLRIAVQLVDASSGSHMWAETYERTFTPDAIFELQDDLVPRIVSTVADMHGVLARSMGEALRSKTPEQLTPYEAVLRSFSYFERITGQELAASRTGLELAVKQVPDYSDAWAMLALLCVQDFVQGIRLQSDSMVVGALAAQRAVETGPSNPLAYFALAQVLFFQKELQGCRHAVEKAVALNPLDGNTLAFSAELLSYSGYEERGMDLAARAKQLNPNHPGWYWIADFYHAYSKGDYRGAVDCMLKTHLAGHYGLHMLIAAAYGQLGETKAAAKSLQELLKLRPEVPSIVRSNAANWWNPEYCERFLDGLRKAGMVVPDEDVDAAPALDTSSAPARSESGAARTRVDEGFWVAVLPFKFAGAGAELKALADGMSEEIITGMSRFSYLRVIARGSTLRYANQATDLRIVGKELGARYVMEGNLRQAGTKLRIAVQLVDTISGAHLWAETYDRAFLPEEIFALQDELVPRIVCTVADRHGVLPHTMSEAVRSKDETRLTPHEAVLRAFGYFERITPDEHVIVLRILERAVKDAPENADCWAMLSMLYRGGYAQGYNAVPDALGRALAAAQRAVDAAPSNHLAYFALASTLFFQKDKLAFRAATERCLELNPMDGASMAFLGMLMSGMGDWEHGEALLKSAMRLNPNHPGWYQFAIFYNAYHKREYRKALDAALRINLPGYFYTHAAQVAAYGQLGDRAAAQVPLQKLLALRPNFASEAREEFGKWHEEEVEHILDGLRQAGLEIPQDSKPSGFPPPSSPVATTSGAARAAVREDEGFWVAVLPFKYSGGNADLTALAEGLTEDIVMGLSRFSYLRVMSRSATQRMSSDAEARSAGKELGARYVMEGSLRHAGSKLRIAVQLVDTNSGAHLWAENYERPFNPDNVFELQDEIVPRVVSTCADSFGVLARSISDAVRGKASGQLTPQLTPYEALMRGFGYHHRLTPEEHAEARQLLERAVEQAPGNADCWAMLSWVYSHEYGHGFNPRPGSLDRSLAAARRAVELAPSNQLAQQALAVALFFRKEKASCLNAAERALALNPWDGSNEAIFLITFTGDWERGCALIKRSMELNPHHPGWYWLVLSLNQYRTANYRAAVDAAVRSSTPGMHWTHFVQAACYGQLGEREAAQKALRQLLALRPDYAAEAREDLAKWLEPELAGQVIDGLRKAGLEIAEEAAD